MYSSTTHPPISILFLPLYKFCLVSVTQTHSVLAQPSGQSRNHDNIHKTSRVFPLRSSLLAPYHITPDNSSAPDSDLYLLISALFGLIACLLGLLQAYCLLHSQEIICRQKARTIMKLTFCLTLTVMQYKSKQFPHIFCPILRLITMGQLVQYQYFIKAKVECLRVKLRAQLQ